MLILVVGKSYSAVKISDKFAKNDDNIVFSTANSQNANNIDINPGEITEIKDFINANEINLLVVADAEYTGIDFQEALSDTECLCFCPDTGLKFHTNRSTAKKFAYKNKIQTPKFAVFDKQLSAQDYIQDATFPLVIAPDTLCDAQKPFIAETKSKAAKEIDNLFQKDNKKIVIENYIEGVEYTKYIISDGVNIFDFFETISYFDEVSTNNMTYMSDVSREKINNEIIPLIFNSFMEEGFDYCGILGIKFLIDKDNNPYFQNFLPFIENLDVDIMLNSIDADFAKLFYDAAAGEFKEKCDNINENSKYVISFFRNGEIATGCANTMNGAIELALVEGADKNNINEAIKFWKR